jgi:hypothetical protein
LLALQAPEEQRDCGVETMFLCLGTSDNSKRGQAGWDASYQLDELLGEELGLGGIDRPKGIVASQQKMRPAADGAS